jgi:hypothetical protein
LALAVALPLAFLSVIPFGNLLLALTLAVEAGPGLAQIFKLTDYQRRWRIQSAPEFFRWWSQD